MRRLCTQIHLLNENAARKQLPAPGLHQIHPKSWGWLYSPSCPSHPRSRIPRAVPERVTLGTGHEAPLSPVSSHPDEHTCPHVLLDPGPWQNVNQIQEKQKRSLQFLPCPDRDVPAAAAESMTVVLKPGGFPGSHGRLTNALATCRRSHRPETVGSSEHTGCSFLRRGASF